MQKVLTPKEMSEVDSYMIREMEIPSLLLMENAAMGVANAVMDRVAPCIVHVFCGTGNNGGDGFAAARILLSKGYDVCVFVLGDAERLTQDARSNVTLLEKLPGVCVSISDIAEYTPYCKEKPAAVIDAIFGTGLSRDVTGIYKDVIDQINKMNGLKVSVDIPSGIDGATGHLLGGAVLADVTVTFQYPKIGHFLFPGRKHTGVLETVKIGVDDGCQALTQSDVCAYRSDDGDLRLGSREMDAHKGDFGRLLLVAGSYGMAGAAVLSARAAARAGAGLVTLASIDEVVAVVQTSVPEATCRVLANEEGSITRNSIFDIDRAAKGKTALAIGPGISLSNDTHDIVEHIVKNHELTKILDADAISALAGRPEVFLEKTGEVILTPHAKEFASLLDVTTEHVLNNSLTLAEEFAARYKVTLVLKGATTIVADGSGKVALVAAGSPAMAKGGSGDVLTGVISGLAAQGKKAYDAALLGVYIAAMAGEKSAGEWGEYSVLATDSVEHIGDVMKRMTV
ncbi:MAG: NAD(P)H-hydrate dehydratase, partial [Christensenellaceae bacterium]